LHKLFPASKLSKNEIFVSHVAVGGDTGRGLKHNRSFKNYGYVPSAGAKYREFREKNTQERCNPLIHSFYLSPNFKTHQFLYKFFPVLDGNQVHKLYNIVAGLLDVSVFSKDEIEQLEKRLARVNTQNRYAVAN